MSMAGKYSSYALATDAAPGQPMALVARIVANDVTLTLNAAHVQAFATYEECAEAHRRLLEPFRTLLCIAPHPASVNLATGRRVNAFA